MNAHHESLNREFTGGTPTLPERSTHNNLKKGKTMKTQTRLKGLLLGGMAAVIGTTGAISHELEAKLAEGGKPSDDQAKVQIAILLDTSGSMSGLIEQTKTQLWQIVNTFIDAKQNGKVPFVEVALYEYGNDGLNRESHWVRVELDVKAITGDMEKGVAR